MYAIQIHKLCWDGKGCRAVCMGLIKNFERKPNPSGNMSLSDDVLLRINILN